MPHLLCAQLTRVTLEYGYEVELKAFFQGSTSGWVLILSPSYVVPVPGAATGVHELPKRFIRFLGPKLLIVSDKRLSCKFRYNVADKRPR